MVMLARGRDFDCTSLYALFERVHLRQYLSRHCLRVSIEHGFIKKSSIPALSAMVRFSSTACAVNVMIGVVTPISRSSVAVVMPSDHIVSASY